MKPRCEISFFIPQFKYRNVKFSLPNSISDNNISNYKKENEDFINRAVEAFEKLLKKAKQNNELHFIFTLNPTGFAGITTTQFTSMYEAFRAFDDYVDFIFNKNADNLSIRIALALYCHLSEARGFYQIPKNLLRILNGEFYNPRPFDHLLKIHKKTGALISPNATELMKDLMGHSESVGLHDLAMVFKDAFHIPLRNGFAHADYKIVPNGISLPYSNKGKGEILKWDQFECLITKGLNFFNSLRNVVEESLEFYKNKKTIRGQLSNKEEECEWEIFFDSDKREMTISG